MRLFLVFILCLFFSLSSSRASDTEIGGISLATTRVIFPSDKNSIGLTVNNSSKQDAWLLRSWVTSYQLTENKDKKKTEQTAPVPFVITPPLYRIEPDGRIQLRINGTSVSSLPADRESVFHINVMAIPPRTTINEGKETTAGGLSGGYVQFAINNQIKLFYRPAALNAPAKLDAARQRLVSTREGNTIVINNPTPYYFTLVNLRVNGRSVPDENIPDTMVAPFGHLRLPVPDARSLEYQTINDFGGYMDTEKVVF